MWASLITNTGYLPGLLTLHHSLQKVGTKYPFVALYTEQFPEEGHRALEDRGIQKRKVEYVTPAGQKDYTNDPRFYDTWTKLTVFGLLEYERAILLDGDMLVIQNMDELMDLPLDSVEQAGAGNKVFAAAPACVCNPAKRAHYPKDWFVSFRLDRVLLTRLGYLRTVLSHLSIQTQRKHKLLDQVCKAMSTCLTAVSW